MPVDGHIRAVDICCANPELQAITDLVLGKVGSKESLHFTRDEAVVTVHLHHGPTPATHLKRILAPLTFSQLESDTKIKNTLMTNQDAAEKFPKPHHISAHEPLTDIQLGTLTGECVPEHEAPWELNPYAKVFGDTSGLMGIVQGHHHLLANTTAKTLCALVPTNLRSQFYKNPPTRESKPTLQLLWSFGKGKVINSRKRFASRRQALVARGNAVSIVTGPLATTPKFIPSENQGRPTHDVIYQEASTQELNTAGKAVPLIDNNLFYTNGNPKPPLSMRPRV